MSPASFFRPDKWPRTPAQFLEAAASIPLTPGEWWEAAEEVRRSPSRMFLDLVHSVALSLRGREVEIRTGESDVTFVLDEVTYDHDPPLVPWIPGNPMEVVDEIDITTSTVRWSAGQIDKLRVIVRNVTLDPGVVATAPTWAPHSPQNWVPGASGRPQDWQSIGFPLGRGARCEGRAGERGTHVAPGPGRCRVCPSGRPGRRRPVEKAERGGAEAPPRSRTGVRLDQGVTERAWAHSLMRSTSSGLAEVSSAAEAESSEACWVISAASALVGSSIASCSC